jgi:ATP adenylyltransferase
MLNLYPYNPGHMLIVPNRHLSRVQELEESERGELAEWVAKLEGVLRGSYKPDGINVGMNLGKAAGAGIEDHLHVHMVPRWNGDTNFMPVFFGTKVISEALKDSFRKIRQALL